MSAIVAADHVSKWYGQVIGLNDVSVEVPPGITGLLGPNGAGKSTFMKLITGQLKPSKGVGQGAGRADLGQPAPLLRNRVLPRAGRLLRADDRPRVGDGAGAAERAVREGRRRRGAAGAHRRRLDGRRRQEDRRLQQGHAAAGQAGAGDRPRSRAADPRRAAGGDGSAGAPPHHPDDSRLGPRRQERHRLEPHPARDRVDDRQHPADQQRPDPRRGGHSPDPRADRRAPAHRVGARRRSAGARPRVPGVRGRAQPEVRGRRR